MLRRIIPLLVALGLASGIGVAVATTSQAAPAAEPVNMAHAQAVAQSLGFPAGAYALTPAQARANPSLVSGNGTNDFYLGPEECWIGSVMSLESTNWDNGSNQTYHLWIWKQYADWGVGFYLDGVWRFDDKKDGHLTHEYYVGGAGHGSHRLGIRGIGDWCAYYQ